MLSDVTCQVSALPLESQGQRHTLRTRGRLVGRLAPVVKMLQGALRALDADQTFESLSDRVVAS